MKTSELRRLERHIKTSEGDGVIWRWRYGRALLTDPDSVNEAGTLRRGRGVVERLTAIARSEGRRLSEREIRYRLRAARVYPSEAAIRQQAAVYGSWRDLCDAGLPAAAEGTDDDPNLTVQDDHLADEDDLQPPLDAGATEAVFPPVVRIDGAPHRRDDLTVRTLLEYLETCERRTAGHARVNATRRAQLEELIAAGLMDVRYGEALRRSRRREAS